MPVLDEKKAWRMLERYARKCSDIDRLSLYAVYAVGSLPGGYYRPGQSDVDAVLVVADGTELVWGNCETPSQKLADLNARFRRDYEIPGDFGPFPVQPCEMIPPYDPARELTVEIARLKLQGRLVYGAFSLQDVPMPNREDFLEDFRHFEEWWESVFAAGNPPETLEAGQCVNTVLLYLSRYLIVEKGILEFDKTRMVARCVDSGAPFLDEKPLSLVQGYVEGRPVRDEDMDCLRSYAMELRGAVKRTLQI